MRADARSSVEPRQGITNVTREIVEGITVDPKVMVGKPVIKGTRMPVDLVLAKLAANPVLDEFFLDYPELTLDQVRACLRYAARLAQDKECARRAATRHEAAQAAS
jgi:uncharacterized protein (DUF433 family)